MRNTFADEFYLLGKGDPRLVVIVADISPAGSIAKFREHFPERFVNTGVAEQIMIGLAAGMAQRGMRPFAYTIATFALFRPYEMIRLDLGYQNLPVTVVGIGGGVVYSTLGATHHAMEDVSIAASIPNMQVVAPCDPAETRLVTRYLATDNMKPTYLRLNKAGEPDLTANALEPFVFGKLRYLQRGKDTCLMAYGPIMKMAFDVAARLEDTGESVSVVSAHTIKPLDIEGVAEALTTHRRVVVLEEHVPHGGLGSRIKEIAWDIRASCDLLAFSLKDEFIHCYGSHETLLAEHGLSLEVIMKRLTK